MVPGEILGFLPKWGYNFKPLTGEYPQGRQSIKSVFKWCKKKRMKTLVNSTKNKEILCTLGPASLNDRVISRLEEYGVSLFRINLSHIEAADVESVIRFIQERTKVPVCIDTEGAQIRTGHFEGKTQMSVIDNAYLIARKLPAGGDENGILFYPSGIIDCFENGDLINIDFDAVLAQVIRKGPEETVLRVLNGGVIRPNRAVNIHRNVKLPVLTEKDRQAVRAAMRLGVRDVALSFANRGSDVDELRALCAPGTRVISKIECQSGLVNLEDIAVKSDAVLIDRGDLSREVPIEHIPRLQKMIIRRAKKHKKKVYVATNLLESMVTSRYPTRAEVNDVINTLHDGADGLVLAAETTIGRDPLGCTAMIVKLIHEFESGGHEDDTYYTSDVKSFLVKPHGGKLVHLEAGAEDRANLGALRRLTVSKKTAMDCEQIAVGAYSPLRGFMTKETLEGVLEDCRLPGGTPWTMPLLLQPAAEEARTFGKKERLLLVDPAGAEIAVMDLKEKYAFDLKKLAQKWFGTANESHPGVSILYGGGDVFLAGEVRLLGRPEIPFSHYKLTPAQSRYVFTHKGWSRVVGFHTRNIAHRAHEYIQLAALESTGADGLLISPLVGTYNNGDFLAEAIIKSYKKMMDLGFYPRDKVVLGCFSTYPRYCGPREAVFTAICRKNMGCSHFIIGRNHAGVGDYYRDEDYREMFEKCGDIGIEPVFFGEVGYDPGTGKYAEITGGGRVLPISGSEVRKVLQDRKYLPAWHIREEVQKMIMDDILAGREVFCR